jgi:hypothetical protein
MNAPTLDRPPRITTAQRATIRRLLRESGRFDDRTVTAMHRLAGVGDEWIGRSVDAWLDSLDLVNASRAIVRLSKMNEEFET